MGGILAAIAAGPRPVEVPTIQDVQARNMQLQALAQEGMLRQQQAALTGMKMQEAQQDWIERQALMGGMARAIADPNNKAADGSQDWDKTYSSLQADPDVAGRVRPQTLGGLQTMLLDQREKVAGIGQKIAAQHQAETDIATKNAALRKEYTGVIGNFAQDQLDKGDLDPLNTISYLQMHRAYAPDADSRAQIDGAIQTLHNNPDQTLSVLRTMAGGLLPDQREARSKATGEAAKSQEAQTAAGLQMIRTLPLDPNTNLPTEDSWTATQKAFPGLKLPDKPDQGTIDRLTEAGMKPAEVPEYRIKTTEAQATKDLLANPQRVQLLVAGAIDPKKYPDEFNRTWNRAMFALQTGGVPAMRQEIDKGADNVAGLERGIAQAKATVPFKIDVAAGSAAAKEAATAAAGGMTQDDVNREGQLYALTGQINAGRDSVLRQKIIHAGNEWARSSGLSPRDMLVARAAYQGDVASLKKFQTNRDQIVSFEQTAQKNLDLFINQAQQIVDTGVPWINKPIRELDQKLLGSSDIAAVNAARQVANNEVAKVTSGGGLSGVLSDSARHEVDAFNPQGATLKQTLAVAKVLRADMANRHQSMDDALQNIKERIGGQPPTPAPATAAPKATHRYNPQTKQIEAIP